jgi:hypothetical protein
MIHYLRALAARLRGLFGDRRADRELDDEIETHVPRRLLICARYTFWPVLKSKQRSRPL